MFHSLSRSHPPDLRCPFVFPHRHLDPGAFSVLGTRRQLFICRPHDSEDLLREGVRPCALWNPDPGRFRAPGHARYGHAAGEAAGKAARYTRSFVRSTRGGLRLCNAPHMAMGRFAKRAFATGGTLDPCLLSVRNSSSHRPLFPFNRSRPSVPRETGTNRKRIVSPNRS